MIRNFVQNDINLEVNLLTPVARKHLYLHHRYLVGLAFIPQHRTPESMLGLGFWVKSCPIDRIFALKFSRSPYFDKLSSESIHT